MIHRWTDIEQLALYGSDGEIGVLDDALVDDRWVVRYFVAAPGALLHQRVVISPIQVRTVDWARRVVEVRLSTAQARESPDLLSVTPLTRDAEWAYASYYGFPAYWGGPDLWAWAGHPRALLSEPPVAYRSPDADTSAAPLQSAKGLRGRHLAALDGKIGHVDDTFVDEESWRLSHLLVDTSNWIGGRHVLLPTAVVPSLDAAGADLVVDRTVERIREAPAYDPGRPIDADMEQHVARHFGVQEPPSTRAAGRA